MLAQMRAILMLLLVASCDDPGVTLVPDAAPDAGPDADLCDIDVCNPVAQTSCGLGEKCTWIHLDSSTGRGELGCVADQPVASGDACTVGPDGPTTGYDDCARGDLCVDS